MEQIRKVKYLIIGQGLAGTCFALHCAKKNIKYVIVDKDTPNASKVGAGIINPVTGKQLNKTWELERFLIYSRSFYREFGDFFVEKKILKVFKSEKELEKFKTRINASEFKEYLSDNFQLKKITNDLNGGFQACFINNGGYLKTGEFLHHHKREFIKRFQYIDDFLLEKDLHIFNDRVSWKNIEAEQVIFANGSNSNFSFLNKLIFRKAKGEILTVHIKDLDDSYIYNKEIFILPIGNSKYKVGATYSWDLLDDIPSFDAYQYLTNKLKNFCKKTFKVLEHNAAVRPILTGRIPAIGKLPDLSQIAIINGLGSKGALFAPKLSEMLFMHLENNKPILEELDVKKRFYSF